MALMLLNQINKLSISGLYGDSDDRILTTVLQICRPERTKDLLSERQTIQITVARKPESEFETLKYPLLYHGCSTQSAHKLASRGEEKQQATGAASLPKLGINS